MEKYDNLTGRRDFLAKSGLMVLGGLAGASLITSGSCKNDEEDITPPEDLMREHGVLNRVLLIYDHFNFMLANNVAINPQHLLDSANIIKTFIEDYHEKQEEDFVFPRFEKANKLTDLVKTLREQHAQGRLITNKLIEAGKQPKIETDDDKQRIHTNLSTFIRMYRPHEAREDTVLFPAIREIVSKHEFDSMGEDFEKREHQLFGSGGFEVFVEKVSGIEKQSGIYDLGQFTPFN